MSRKDCVFLMPVGTTLDEECRRALNGIVKLGYDVKFVHGNSNIVNARNSLASIALAEGYERLFWIDSDIVFKTKDVLKLLQSDCDFVGATYPKRGAMQMTCRFLKKTKKVVFGEGGGLVEAMFVGTGFLMTRRRVYDRIREHYELVPCYCRDACCDVYDYFAHETVKIDGRHSHLGEDFSLCHKAERCGFKVFIDTSIKLIHIGRYGYTWDDVFLKRPQVPSVSVSLKRKKEEGPK